MMLQFAQGCDDIEEAAMISVPLTTVHQRKYVLGQKAPATTSAGI